MSKKWTCGPSIIHSIIMVIVSWDILFPLCAVKTPLAKWNDHITVKLVRVKWKSWMPYSPKHIVKFWLSFSDLKPWILLKSRWIVSSNLKWFHPSSLLQLLYWKLVLYDPLLNQIYTYWLKILGRRPETWEFPSLVEHCLTNSDSPCRETQCQRWLSTPSFDYIYRW